MNRSRSSRQSVLPTAALTLVVAACLGVALAGSGLVGASKPAPRPHAAHSPVYASQSTSRVATRRAHVRWASGEAFEGAYETCETMTLEDWAQRLQVIPDVAAVARTFAERYLPAIRPAAYDGCLEALRMQPDEPRAPAAE